MIKTFIETSVHWPLVNAIQSNCQCEFVSSKVKRLIKYFYFSDFNQIVSIQINKSMCPNCLNLVCTWAAGETTRAGSASGCREERAAKRGTTITYKNTYEDLFLECVRPPNLLSTHLHKDAGSLGRRERDFVHEVRDVPGRVREAGVKSLCQSVSQSVSQSVCARCTQCMMTKQKTECYHIIWTQVNKSEKWNKKV